MRPYFRHAPGAPGTATYDIGFLAHGSRRGAAPTLGHDLLASSHCADDTRLRSGGVLVRWSDMRSALIRNRRGSWQHPCRHAACPVATANGDAMLLRKMLSAGPLRITLSRQGTSASVGGSWWRVQAGGAGSHYTLRIPGTGVSLHRARRRK